MNKKKFKPAPIEVLINNGKYGRFISTRFINKWFTVVLLNYPNELPPDNGYYLLSASEMWVSEKTEEYSEKVFARGEIDLSLFKFLTK